MSEVTKLGLTTVDAPDTLALAPLYAEISCTRPCWTPWRALL
jgi:hypothetical protein